MRKLIGQELKMMQLHIYILIFSISVQGNTQVSNECCNSFETKPYVEITTRHNTFVPFLFFGYQARDILRKPDIFYFLVNVSKNSFHAHKIAYAETAGSIGRIQLASQI